MASSSKKRTDEKPVNGFLNASTLSKAFASGSTWEDKDEFLDVIYWMRQVFGLVQGLIWGLLPLKGFFGLLLFFVFNLGIVYLYYNMFQKIDDEEYGGATEILKEGLMTSFAAFLVTWIIIYSSLHTSS
ncbi:GEL complex subunit OPTI-like [Saccostrea echinata]|uniref:GEL complex subunit OPTI-like n=1 Tax=Saccostrea echinata TaxID=191078 RepID=UPI002A8257E3|nr:GEL complex subunit OPTI-like [Saccostrea echinata]